MSNCDGWAERATGRAAVSGEGTHRWTGGAAAGTSPAPHTGSRQSPADKGRATPGVHGIPSLRWYAGSIAAAARSVGKAIIGAPHSPRAALKHSTSDDMELAGYPLLNGLSPGPR